MLHISNVISKFGPAWSLIIKKYLHLESTEEWMRKRKLASATMYNIFLHTHIPAIRQTDDETALLFKVKCKKCTTTRKKLQAKRKRYDDTPMVYFRELKLCRLFLSLHFVHYALKILLLCVSRPGCVRIMCILKWVRCCVLPFFSPLNFFCYKGSCVLELVSPPNKMMTSTSY